MPIKKVSREDAIASNLKMEEERQESIQIKENLPNIKIPNDTFSIIKKNDINIDNFHLKLNRFSKFDEDNGYKLQNQDISETFLNKNWSFYQSKITNYYKDIQNLNLNFSNPIKLKTDYRLVIGAEQSIYETSIRLHHTYGVPFIPSTAIKGVVRSYIELEGKLDDFIDLFGTQEREGKIIFFDAFSITPPKLKMDIINPMEEDKIINFVIVEDTTFQFCIASKEKIDESFIMLFKEALEDHGIGGKTAVGYGYLSKLA